MALVEWNADLELGIDEFDEQHKKLVGMINDLNDAMSAGQGQDQLGMILTKLADYTSYHFSSEEKYFDQSDYPEAAGHRRAHKEFINQINDYQMEFDAGQLLLSMKVMNFLSDWLVAHIQGIDRQYVPYIKKDAA